MANTDKALYALKNNLYNVRIHAGNVLYYNGIPTVKKKTAYAMQNAGGVMIWELMEDADTDKSLLNAIDKTVKGK